MTLLHYIDKVMMMWISGYAFSELYLWTPEHDDLFLRVMSGYALAALQVCSLGHDYAF